MKTASKVARCKLSVITDQLVLQTSNYPPYARMCNMIICYYGVFQLTKLVDGKHAYKHAYMYAWLTDWHIGLYEL